MSRRQPRSRFAAVATRRLAPLSFAILAVSASWTWLGAQEDFRHMDEGRPTRIEDAYPLKFLEWEWQLGAGGAFEGNDRYDGESVLELKVGAAPNFQVGVETHLSWERALDANTTGVEAFALHALYNFNQEGRTFPAMAIRTDLLLPGLGDLGQTKTGGRAKVMATRGVGTTRLHGNVAREWRGAADEGSRWTAGVGFDRPLGLTSRAVVGAISFESFDLGGPTHVWIDAGVRIQITKQSVLDTGLSFRADEWIDGVANVGLVIGLSRAFGFSRLAGVPPYPNPPIR